MKPAVAPLVFADQARADADDTLHYGKSPL
jgi:hypothetical protein